VGGGACRINLWVFRGSTSNTKEKKHEDGRVKRGKEKGRKNWAGEEQSNGETAANHGFVARVGEGVPGRG